MNFFIYILFIIYFDTVISQESWNTNTFDYSWNKSFNRLIYREPIVFTPFEIKGGYFHYGGSDYLGGFPILGGDLSKHPVITDDTHSYSGLSELKDRNGLFVELDILKTNLLLYVIPQNILDVQFGLGYRMSHMLSRPKLPDDWGSYENSAEPWQEYRFYPQMYDFNINTTINFQFTESIIPYLYHSIGFTKISLYKTEGNETYLSGNAISESFALGIKKILNNISSNPKYNLYYGVELKSLKTTTLTEPALSDPENFSPITGFDMRGINLNLTFGVLFGGKRTVGDDAFSLLLENKYGLAANAFSKYIDKYPKHGRIKKAQKMLAFAKAQDPYVKLKKGESQLSNGKIMAAVSYFNDAYIVANDSLKLEISLKKQRIAQMLIEEVRDNFDNYSIRQCEELLNNSKSISRIVDQDARLLKGKLFFKKASLLHESNLLFDAIKYYDLAIKYNKDLIDIINDRIEIIINNFLSNSQAYKENNEITLMLESLYMAINLDPQLSYKLNPIISEFEYLNQRSNEIKTQRKMLEIVNFYKSKHKDKTLDLTIGMPKDRIITYFDMPDNIEFIRSSLDEYEIWVYIKHKKKLFFKNEKLYQVLDIKE